MNQKLRRQQRKQESLIQNFEFTGPENFQLICSSSDIGVQINLGRAGARFAPKVLINELKKLSNITQLKLNCIEVANHESEQIDFNKAQQIESDQIYSQITKNIPFIHLGGGHDHVYPLLKAVEKKYSSIFIINIDPHLDCRAGKLSHSGTPFFQFMNESKSQYQLLQYGTKNYSNSLSSFQNHNRFPQAKTLDSSIKLSVDYLWQNWADILQDSFVFISLDCDSIKNFQAVSAPAHEGIEFKKIKNFILNSYQNFPQIGLGIYEINPLYDDLANSSSRKVVSMIHEIIDSCLNT